MKVRNANGAATKTAKTSTQNTRGSDEAAWRACFERRELEMKAAQAKRDAASITLSVTLDPETYGIFCAAGVVHKCTPAQAVEIMLRATESACEWASANYQADLE